jgi:hypothetical protein
MLHTYLPGLRVVDDGVDFGAGVDLEGDDVARDGELVVFLEGLGLALSLVNVLVGDVV